MGDCCTPAARDLCESGTTATASDYRPTPRSALTASSAGYWNSCRSRACWSASLMMVLWLLAVAAASGQTNLGAPYDRAAVVQSICRQYAATQHALPYNTMYAQCMHARGYRVSGFSPTPSSPGYQGELPGSAAQNGGA